ncbi:hypothetical protein PRIPAC_72207, partial [Pristionchus pacificus]
FRQPPHCLMINAAAICLTFLHVASSLSTYPIVRTSYGAVRGYEYQAKNGFVGEVYKKIPFAAPPTGERRWNKPAPHQPWNHTLDGTFFGPACAQVPSHWEGYVTGTSEDCLTLNVYTSRTCRESNATCPVVVFFHGGSTLTGGTTVFPDETLVTNFAKRGIIMVTAAYRLGVFGVMTLGDEHVLPANLALHDAVASLRFVRSEIHSFGGDRDQVTIMGQSAGATIVVALVFSPFINLVDNDILFSRVIAMSSCLILKSEESQVNISHAVAAKLGCSGTAREIIDCMRPLSTDEIINAASAVGGPDMSSSVSHLRDITLAGDFFPFLSVRELRKNQKRHMEQLSSPTKLLLGTMLNEFKVEPLVSNINASVNEVTEVLGLFNNEECVQKYNSDVASGAFDPGYDTLSQALFVSNALYASVHARTGAETYLYQYEYAAYSMHGYDMYYVLGSHAHPMDENEEWLSRVYPLYFSNFIRGMPPAPDWERFEPDLMNYYSINKSFAVGASPKMKYGYHQNLNEYYSGMVQFDQNLTDFKEMVCIVCQRQTIVEILFAPIQYKKLVLHSTTPINIRHLLFYGTLVGIFIIAMHRSRNFRRITDVFVL